MPVEPVTPPVEPVVPDVPAMSEEDRIMLSIVMNNVGTMSTAQMFSLYLVSVAALGPLKGTQLLDLDYDRDGMVTDRDYAQMRVNLARSVLDEFYINELGEDIDSRVKLEPYDTTLGTYYVPGPVRY